MRILIFVSLITLSFSSGSAQDSSRFFRLKPAEPVIMRPAEEYLSILMLNEYGMASTLGGNRYKDAYPLPFDTLTIYRTMMNSFSHTDRMNTSIINPKRVSLKTERGCPAPAKKRKYPCTVREQLKEFLANKQMNDSTLNIIPIFYIDRQAHDAPAVG